MSGGLLEDADRSKNYVCQVPGSGKYKVWTDGGLHMQWFGNLRTYSKTSQIAYEEYSKTAEIVRNVYYELEDCGRTVASYSEEIFFDDREI